MSKYCSVKQVSIYVSNLVPRPYQRTHHFQYNRYSAGEMHQHKNANIMCTIALVLPASCVSLLPGVAHRLTNHTHRFGSTGGLAVYPREKLLLAAGYDLDKGNANINGTSISWSEGLA